MSLTTTQESARIQQFDSTEEWLRARRRGIGSSDAPAILGLTPWRSALQVYHEKRATFGDAEITPQYVEMAKWGLELEDAIARRYAIETQREIIKPAAHTITYHPDLSFALATIDRYALVPQPLPVPNGVADHKIVKIVVELKNAHWMSRDKWEGSDEDDDEDGRSWAEPPLDYVVQVQHQLGITGAPFASIAVLIGGVEFRWADIKRDDLFIAGLYQREQAFWNDVIRGVEPPADGSEATKALLRKLHPKDNGDTVELPPEAIEWADQLEIAKAAIKTAKVDKQTAENRLKQAIGDATFATLRDGRAFSFKTQDRKETVQAATSFRVLRPIKGGGR